MMESKAQARGTEGNLTDAAFEKALAQALARVEAAPPVFLIPPEISLPGAFERSVDKVGRAMDISRSALRLAFNFM